MQCPLGLQTLHITALTKLRLYKEADSQLLNLGNLDQSKYGNAVPMALRLIKAEMPHFMAGADQAENSRKAQNNLYALQSRVLGKNAPSGAQQTTKSLASLELDAALPPASWMWP